MQLWSVRPHVRGLSRSDVAIGYATMSMDELSRMSKDSGLEKTATELSLIISAICAIFTKRATTEGRTSSADSSTCFQITEGVSPKQHELSQPGIVLLSTAKADLLPRLLSRR